MDHGECLARAILCVCIALWAGYHFGQTRRRRDLPRLLACLDVSRNYLVIDCECPETDLDGQPCVYCRRLETLDRIAKGGEG